MPVSKPHGSSTFHHGSIKPQPKRGSIRNTHGICSLKQLPLAISLVVTALENKSPRTWTFRCSNLLLTKLATTDHAVSLSTSLGNHYCGVGCWTALHTSRELIVVIRYFLRQMELSLTRLQTHSFLPESTLFSGPGVPKRSSRLKRRRS